MQRSTKLKRWMKMAAGVALAVALLWFFFRGTNWAEVTTSLSEADFVLLALVVALNVTSLVTRAWRWQLLLRPLKEDIRFSPPWRYYNVGFAVTSLLPGRLGELLRPYLLARDQGLSFTSALASIATERVIDLTVVLALLASAFIFPDSLGPRADDPAFSRYIEALELTGLLALLAVVVGVIFLSYVKLKTERATALIKRLLSPFPRGFSSKVVTLIEAFAAGLGGLRTPRQLFGLTGTTLLSWFVILLSYYGVLRAFDLVVPFHHVFFFVAVVALGVVVPTPGGAGTFHMAILLVAGDLWGFAATQAGAVAACAIVAHLLAILPIVTLGSFYSLREGINVFRTVEEAQLDEKIAPS